MQKVKFLIVNQGKKDAFTDILKQANISFQGCDSLAQVGVTRWRL